MTRKSIALCLAFILLSACALKPAPITTLNVRAALNSAPAAEKEVKRVELTKEIRYRKVRLKNVGNIPWQFWVIDPFTTTVVWLCMSKRRSQAREEIQLLNAKEIQIDPSRDDCGDDDFSDWCVGCIDDCTEPAE